MTNEAFIIRIKRILNEIKKRPNLDLAYRVKPLMQEFRNSTTKSSSEELIEFCKKEFKTNEEFIEAFNKVSG